MPPKVTVLMAVRDGEPYVREALRSVLTQTFTDFEVLVVDDASTDATVGVVEAFDDPRVRVLRNDRNLGQVPSLNRGMHEARGEYIARIDADDACLPARLARQVDVLDAEPRVCLVGTWMQAIDERGRRLGRLEKTLTDFVDFLYHTLIMRVYVSHPAAMYRREPVLALGGYDEATGPSEDKDLWRKLVLERYEARIVPQILMLYRLHDRQLSQVRAAHQRKLDCESQDRFLSALAPEANAPAVRRLLAGDPAAWDDDPKQSLAGVELVLAGAHERLALADDEVHRLTARVAARLLEVADGSPWRRPARIVAAHAIRHISGERRTAARRRHAVALGLAPAIAGGRWAVRSAADHTESLPGLGRLRARARRSRLARRLYAKAIGNE